MAKKILPGRAVTIASKRSHHKAGRVVEVSESLRGNWVTVNVGDKKNPEIRKYRESEVSVA